MQELHSQIDDDLQWVTRHHRESNDYVKVAPNPYLNADEDFRNGQRQTPIVMDRV